MPNKLHNDHTGQRFGNLLAVEYEGAGKWRCICDCGVKKSVAGARMRDGSTRSCGCLSSSESANRSRGRAKHGMSGSRTYNIWALMLQRCKNPLATEYRLYGGRGISVCTRWASFENFLADMGECPSSAHSIERANSNGNYCPENCEWATAKEQTRNTSRNRNFTVDGETKCLMDWCGGCHKRFHRARYHLSRGKSIEQVLEICK